mmetsp:Transcript_154153/g.494121  ORF Transcript_154153/g.494121 Transcript_154153/m.494121 type:complete len:434 (+) Transcript_154153:79-1380(+)
MDCSSCATWGQDMLRSWPSSPAGRWSLASTRASSSESLVTAAASHEHLDLAASINRSSLKACLPTMFRCGSLSPERRRRYAALAAIISCILAVAWSRRVRRASRSPAKWGSGLLGLGISSVMVAAFRWLGITARNDILEKAPHVMALEGRQVLACWHPHGLYTVAPLVFHSTHPRNKNSPIYSFATAVASVVFQVPIFRELLLLFDCRAADSKVIDGLLHSGRSVFVCPGGIHEQLETDPEQEQIFFPPQLGFVRQAIKHGVPLVPTYNFGENQLYDVPQRSRAASRCLRKKFNIGIPFGLGRWGLPFLPHQTHLSIRVGSTIEVGDPQDCEVDDEQVREVFRRYCVELQRLFEAHKDTDLPPHLAAKGLRIVWRGHEHEDLSAASLLSEDGASDGKAAIDEASLPPLASQLKLTEQLQLQQQVSVQAVLSRL